MDKETETTINRLLADNKAARDLVDYLAKENVKLREEIKKNYRIIYDNGYHSGYHDAMSLIALKEGE